MSRGQWSGSVVGAFVGLALMAPGALASPVLVLEPSGHAQRRDDPYLPAATPTPAPAVAKAAARPRMRKRPAPTVRSVLERLYRTHQIAKSAYGSYTASFNKALKAEKRLRGTRAAELTAVTVTLHDIAAANQLTPSRLPALFATVDRNRQWWTTGPLLTYGQRVEFAGSQLVWEYYPGQGIQLQELGSFGKADGLYTAGRTQQMTQLLDELIPLAAKRAGGIAWEYYFRFDGGSPPWTSAMAQGTALEALARAYRASHDQRYLQIGVQALPLFEQAPPAGVRVATAAGARYLQYSFTRTDIINAFLQSLIGLYDFARASQNAEAQALFEAGNVQAQAELPGFDTGAWSLYQPGEEDSLDYHDLVTGFLQQLCAKTHAAVYCTTATHFQHYLKTPPALTLLTTTARKGHGFGLRFKLSKISRVGVVVTRGARTVLATSAQFPRGLHTFAVPALKKGFYAVRLAATDLAGNFHRITGTLHVTR